MIAEQINKIIQYFHRPDQSAKIAKERLQIIIMHERGVKDRPSYLSALQDDLLKVISKYVAIKKEDIKFELERREEGCSVLELNITLPSE